MKTYLEPTQFVFRLVQLQLPSGLLVVSKQLHSKQMLYCLVTGRQLEESLQHVCLSFQPLAASDSLSHCQYPGSCLPFSVSTIAETCFALNGPQLQHFLDIFGYHPRFRKMCSHLSVPSHLSFRLEYNGSSVPPLPYTQVFFHPSQYLIFQPLLNNSPQSSVFELILLWVLISSWTLMVYASSRIRTQCWFPYQF